MLRIGTPVPSAKLKCSCYYCLFFSDTELCRLCFDKGMIAAMVFNDHTNYTSDVIPL